MIGWVPTNEFLHDWVLKIIFHNLKDVKSFKLTKTDEYVKNNPVNFFILK
jgi:hypothetical protein